MLVRPNATVGVRSASLLSRTFTGFPRHTTFLFCDRGISFTGRIRVS